MTERYGDVVVQQLGWHIKALHPICIKGMGAFKGNGYFKYKYQSHLLQHHDVVVVICCAVTALNRQLDRAICSHVKI